MEENKLIPYSDTVLLTTYVYRHFLSEYKAEAEKTRAETARSSRARQKKTRETKEIKSKNKNIKFGRKL